jgi:hypothetical protein
VPRHSARSASSPQLPRKLAVDLHHLWESEEEYRPWHLLDKCFEEADIGQRNVYVTKTVKHFQW